MYYVMEHSGEFDDIVYGPFESIRKARKFILEDAKQYYEEIDDVGSDENFGNIYRIVKLIDCVKPVPIVSVRWELRKQ